MATYIYQKKGWPNFTWNHEEVLPLLGKVRNEQGKLIGKMGLLGFDLKSEANLETLTLDVLKSSEIEGEVLNPEQVRSSLAVRLGLEISGLVPSDRNVDGVVDMLLDATGNFSQRLTQARLFNWHYALFPTGRTGMYKIVTGNWRDDSTGPMQVVSGALGKEKVHFQAPAAPLVPDEMKQFLNWFNKNNASDPVIKAAVAHLWFITIHPFEDGNGRIARALTDLLLARGDGLSQRFYSMSAQIRKQRKQYYDILETTQQGGLDITPWLMWFLTCLDHAVASAGVTQASVLFKHRFWHLNRDMVFNARQKLLLTKLMDGFEGKLTSSKWAKIAKCSADTALRDIQDLLNKRVLQKTTEGGRSTHYELAAITD